MKRTPLTDAQRVVAHWVGWWNFWGRERVAGAWRNVTLTPPGGMFVAPGAA